VAGERLHDVDRNMRPQDRDVRVPERVGEERDAGGVPHALDDAAELDLRQRPVPARDEELRAGEAVLPAERDVLREDRAEFCWHVDRPVLPAEAALPGDDANRALLEAHVAVLEPEHLALPETGVDQDRDQREAADALELGPPGVVPRGGEDALELLGLECLRETVARDRVCVRASGGRASARGSGRSGSTCSS